MKNTKNRDVGLIFTEINIMSNHDKKKKLYPVDKNAQSISFHIHTRHSFIRIVRRLIGYARQSNTLIIITLNTTL